MSDLRLSFEHGVIAPLKGVGGHWLLAVSGGVDSMVMAEVLRRWSRGLKIQLSVAHVHHGTKVSTKQKLYRSSAKSLVRAWCKKNEITFYSNRAEPLKLKSEADLREYRLRCLAAWKTQSGASHIAFAHHRDDLLETRILRLIRGTGVQGLGAMQLHQGERLRPLLNTSRAEIERYARAQQIKFADDPSNRKKLPLRNWLREEWLPMLEEKRPGSLAALSRSLEILSLNAVVESKFDVGLRRDLVREFSLPQAEKIVAGYLKSLGVRNYGQRHVRELLKRLSAAPETPFTMLGLVFEFRQDHLRASRV